MSAKGYTGLSDPAVRHIGELVRMGWSPENARKMVERVAAGERNRAIASLRGRLSRVPRLDAAPECVAVVDLVHALDEMEAAS